MLLGVKPSLCCLFSNQGTKLCYRRKKKIQRKILCVWVGDSLKSFLELLKNLFNFVSFHLFSP